MMMPTRPPSIAAAKAPENTSAAMPKVPPAALPLAVAPTRIGRRQLFAVDDTDHAIDTRLDAGTELAGAEGGTDRLVDDAVRGEVGERALETATDLDAHPSILLRDEQDRAVIDALSTGLPGIGDADRILLDLLRLRGRHDEHRDPGSLARLQVHEALDQARTLVGLQQPGGIDHRGIVGRNRLQPALSRSRLHRRRPEGQRGEQQHGPQQPGEEGFQGVAGRLSRPAQAR
jgi:hypothetical protein